MKNTFMSYDGGLKKITEYVKIVDLLLDRYSLISKPTIEEDNKSRKEVNELFYHSIVEEIARILGLTEAEKIMLLFCIAPEIDKKYAIKLERIQGTSMFPSLSVILDLLLVSDEEKIDTRINLEHSILFQLNFLKFDLDNTFNNIPYLLKPIKPSRELLLNILRNNTEFFMHKIQSRFTNFDS